MEGGGGAGEWRALTAWVLTKRVLPKNCSSNSVSSMPPSWESSGAVQQVADKRPQYRGQDTGQWVGGLEAGLPLQQPRRQQGLALAQWLEPGSPAGQRAGPPPPPTLVPLPRWAHRVRSRRPKARCVCRCSASWRGLCAAPCAWAGPGPGPFLPSRPCLLELVNSFFPPWFIDSLTPAEDRVLLHFGPVSDQIFIRSLVSPSSCRTSELQLPRCPNSGTPAQQSQPQPHSSAPACTTVWGFSSSVAYT